MGTSSLARRLALTTTAILVSLGSNTVAPAVGATVDDAPPVGLRATFHAGTGGFTTGFEPARWISSGGNPDGYVSGDGSIETSDRWAGDRSAAYGGRITFDVRVNGEPSRNVEIGIGMVAGQEFIGTETDVPSHEWTTVSFPLTRGVGWYHQNRGPDSDDPTAAEFDSVLRHLQGISFSVRDRADVVIDLDNLVLAGEVARSTSIRRSGARLSGALASPVAACRSQVSVLVVRLTDAGATPVGRDRTTRAGAWSLARDLPAGRYRARVAPRFVPGAGDCSLALSRAVRLR